jgi:GNAT superfamily N-acetyltransferase
MITIKRVIDFSELEGIKKLQQENLKKNLSPDEAATDGFVTAEYSMEFLETMHWASPSIIAKDGDKVIGYALVALESIRHHHVLLADLFNTVDKTTYQNLKLKDSRYVIVGQLCVAKNYRGLGLARKMYQYYRTCLSGSYDYCITDVAQENPKSLKAHVKIGFQVIDTFTYEGNGWDIVLWDWTKPDSTI